MKNLLELSSIPIKEKISHFNLLLKKHNTKKDDIMFPIHAARMRCIYLVYFTDEYIIHNNSKLNSKVPLPPAHQLKNLNTKELEFFTEYLSCETYFRDMIDDEGVITSTKRYDCIEPKFHTYRHEKWLSENKQDGWEIVESKKYIRRNRRIRNHKKKIDCVVGI